MSFLGCDQPPRTTDSASSRKRILVLHNAYKKPGGEDGVVQAEVNLLRQAGHSVELLEEDSKRIHGLGKLRAAFTASYSPASKARVAAAISKFAPDVMHCHNLFPLFSTSVYDAAREAGVPVVQTLHNFRMQCAKAVLMREGRICEQCVGKAFPHPSVRLRCYQGSAVASAAAAASITFNHVRRTYLEKVDIFVALSAFSRNKFIEFGLPPDRILIKPNFVKAEQAAPLEDAPRSDFLFVGRIAAEKGLDTLIAAWRQVAQPAIKLRIVGDGPDAQRLRTSTANEASIEWLGHRPQSEISQLMRASLALVVPSVWYEMFGLVAIEAFAAGTPVIASDIGSLSEIVERDRAGLLVPPGDADELARAITWMTEHPFEARTLGRQARRAYEQRYTAAENLHLLEAVYEKAGDTPAPAAHRPLVTIAPALTPEPGLYSTSLQSRPPAFAAERASRADPGSL
jgi:glycosyltransferase involved in cell wall biosynthesis